MGATREFVSACLVALFLAPHQPEVGQGGRGVGEPGGSQETTYSDPAGAVAPVTQDEEPGF